MKRVVLVATAIALFTLTLAACGGSSTTPTKEIGTVAEWDAGIAEILDAEFFTAGDGTDVIRVNFTYTNPSSDPIYFISAFSIHAFQNGKALDDRVNQDINAEDGADLIREIKDGASLAVWRTFYLEDDSPVEIRVCTATASEDLLAVKTFTP